MYLEASSHLPLIGDSINPLSPNIHIQILQTDLHTFSKRIGWENIKKIKNQSIFPEVIIFTLSFDNVLILLEEIDLIHHDTRHLCTC